MLSLPELKIQVNRSSSQNDLISKNSYIFQDEDNRIENDEKLSKNDMINLSSLPEINHESRTNSVNTLVNSDLKRQLKYASLKQKQPTYPYDAEYAGADYQIVKSRPSIVEDDQMQIVRKRATIRF